MPQVFRVHPSQIGAVLQAHEAQRQQAVLAAVIEAAEFALEMLMKPAASFDTGALRASGHTVINESGSQILFDAPHAVTQELGSRPHWMPLQPLIDWVNRHQATFGISTDAEVKRVARAIQAKIAREGTKPTWFVRGSLPGARIALGHLIKQALTTIV